MPHNIKLCKPNFTIEDPQIFTMQLSPNHGVTVEMPTWGRNAHTILLASIDFSLM